MLTLRAFLVTAAVLAAGLVTLLTAGPAAAERCTRVVHDGGTEYIVNACNACRVVNIRRKRRGIPMPIMRTYNVQARSKFPVSFKGPGKSRISSEVPCKGEAGAGTNIMDPKSRAAGQQTPQKQCVTLKGTPGGNVVLINNCASCRGAAVERYAANGKPMGRQAYKLNPLSVIPIKSKGAAQVGYLADVPCKS